MVSATATTATATPTPPAAAAYRRSSFSLLVLTGTTPFLLKDSGASKGGMKVGGVKDP